MCVLKNMRTSVLIRLLSKIVKMKGVGELKI